MNRHQRRAADARLRSLEKRWTAVAGNPAATGDERRQLKRDLAALRRVVPDSVPSGPGDAVVSPGPVAATTTVTKGI